ncbi:hypothetical protein K8089_07310 [Aequorivita sp. F47161]|uniref:Tail fiber protein n=1 Tax=Aequorivita vitellina TaxID=2874475 RepID=A0A9X1QSX5_9FLAO|nr:hypothetical protein [Aequorivita vitellina]MCG2418826.1 hypothetical protein [Aequorivita vitellina]
MKNKLILLIAILLIASTTWAQVGINKNQPNAALEVGSSILIPRVALQSITDTSTVTNPQDVALVNGTMVYNTGTGSLKRAGFYTWIINKWSFLQREEVGDIKYSVQTTDHGGWYFLDGRATSALTGVANSNSIALFGTHLPDSRNKSLKQRAISETIGTTVGNPSSGLTLLSSNLPVINFSGSTDFLSHSHSVTSNDRGNHTHQYTDIGTIHLSNAEFEAANNPMAEGGTYREKFTNSVSHNHTYSFSNAGSHTHTANTITNAGGTSEAISLRVNKLILNTFIYLGVD